MARTTFNNGGMEEKKGPTFFKIIKTGFNTEDLRIPPKFRRHLLNELSNRATLNLMDSSNSSWTVDVSQTEGEIYFKNGWQKFVRDNSLGNFEFLVFRYESDMQFSIEIFDRNASKRITFPDVRTHRRAAAIHTQSCQSNKLKEVKEEEEDYQDNKEEEAATLHNLEGPAFTSIIGQNFYNLAVPTDFSMKYFPLGYYTIVLKNSEAREWEVSIVPNGKEDSCNTVKLSAGWAAFRRDNQINSGDTCTFKLVESRSMLVHIDPK
ncbi:B3 domain-containing protein Os01g0723500-like [Rosa sericea]